MDKTCMLLCMLMMWLGNLLLAQNYHFLLMLKNRIAQEEHMINRPKILWIIFRHLPPHVLILLCFIRIEVDVIEIPLGFILLQIFQWLRRHFRGRKPFFSHLIIILLIRTRRRTKLSFFFYFHVSQRRKCENVLLLDIWHNSNLLMIIIRWKNICNLIG